MRIRLGLLIATMAVAVGYRRFLAVAALLMLMAAGCDGDGSGGRGNGVGSSGNENTVAVTGGDLLGAESLAPPDIEWINAGVTGNATGLVTAGPGGFVVSRPNDVLEFSVSGVDWARIELQEPRDTTSLIGTPRRPTVAFWTFSTDSLLLITSSVEEGTVGWLSTDGVNWRNAEWSLEFAGRFPQIQATTSDGFFAGTVEGEYFWSTNGETWTEIESPSVQYEMNPPRGTSAGLAWTRSVRSRKLHLAFSPDGSEWVESVIDPVPFIGRKSDITVVSIDHVGPTWILIAEESPGRDGMMHVWTSPDAVTWTHRPTPAFGLSSGNLRFSRAGSDLGDMLVVAAMDTGWTGDMWATTDGVTWSKVLEDMEAIVYLAGRRNADGSYTAVYTTRPIDR